MDYDITRYMEYPICNMCGIEIDLQENPICDECMLYLPLSEEEE